MIAELDKEGFLTVVADWTPELAVELASAQNLDLTPAHQAILLAARDYHDRFGYSPLARSFVKFLQTIQPGISSMTLMQLFPPSTSAGSSIRQICRIGGLPKPAGCL